MQIRRIGVRAAAIFGLLTISYPLISAWFGFAPYRDQHLGTALIYMEQGVNLLQAKIVGFNANDVPTIQEVPWWQAGAAWALRIGGGWWGAANVFSLLVFSLGVSPMFRMGKRLLGDSGAWWAVAAFLAQPIVFLYAGTSSPDGMSLVASLWAYDRIRAYAYQGGWTRAVIASVLAALAATLKLPFFMAAGLAVALEVLLENWKKPTLWGRLTCVATFSAVALLLWTRYTDSWLEKALWPLVDLRVSHNPEMVFWYFGDWAYRLSPSVWIKGIWRMANCLLGSFALGGVMVLGLCLRGNKEARAWLFGAAVTTAVFSHLVLHHSHYYLMFSPAVALAMGGGWMWLMEKCFREGGRVTTVAGAGLILITFAALFQGLIGMKVVQQFDPYPIEIAKKIENYTTKEDGILIIGGGWGGDMLFRAKRRGLSIWSTKFLEDPASLKKARGLGYNKLVVIRESPLLVALQKTNPGGTNYSAEPFLKNISPVAARWPTLYEDENLMIRGIPQN